MHQVSMTQLLTRNLIATCGSDCAQHSSLRWGERLIVKGRGVSWGRLFWRRVDGDNRLSGRRGGASVCSREGGRERNVVSESYQQLVDSRRRRRQQRARCSDDGRKQDRVAFGGGRGGMGYRCLRTSGRSSGEASSHRTPIAEEGDSEPLPILESHTPFRREFTFDF